MRSCPRCIHISMLNMMMSCRERVAYKYASIIAPLPHNLTTPTTASDSLLWMAVGMYQVQGFGGWCDSNESRRT